jgi:hypothetical protein
VRYDRQNAIVGQVVEIFDQPDYSDNNLAITSQIVTLMTEVGMELQTRYTLLTMFADAGARIASFRHHGRVTAGFCKFVFCDPCD